MRPLAWVLFLTVMALAPAARAEPHGQVTFIKGTLERQVGDGRTAILVGGAIDAGDHLFTGQASSAELLFEDGSVVRLAPLTELEVKDLDVPPEGPSLKAQLVLAAGAVWSSVVHLTGGGSYEVSSKWAVAGVRGTRFRVDATPTNGAVEVYRGRVMVTGAEARASVPADPAMVLPGQRLAVDPSGFHPGPPLPVDEFGKWAAERPRPRLSEFTVHPLRESRALQHAERRQERRELRRERR